jgi:mannose-6-phosphate isomerase-like protein (cupin superfamily)
VLYVAAGRGQLEVAGVIHELEPGTAAYIAAGERYTVENPSAEPLLVVSVTAPRGASSARNGGEPVTVRYRDRTPLPASPNREFRYLVNQDLGCHDITQFVGVIPPGRAGMHSHTYDEVVYVISGEGLLHLAGAERPIGRGSCLHLPPLEEHCLENTGAEPMRVLGVFHPSGDPASRATQESGTAEEQTGSIHREDR